MQTPDEEPKMGDGVEQWIDASRRGCNDAMGRLMQMCRQYLLHVANDELESDLQAKMAASDLVQETFLEAQRDFPRFRGETEAELLAWLRRILLHNLANQRRRYRDVDKRRIASEVPIDADSSGADVAGFLAAITPSPSQRAIEHEEVEALEHAIEQLPEDYRQVIVLRQRERRSFEDIGRTMGRSADAARMLWSRAIERLASQLGPRHESR